MSLLSFAASGSALAQAATFTLHVDRDEVVVDLTAIDTHTHRADRTLTPDDVVVLDGTKPVKLTSFQPAAGGAVRPLQVWLIVQCNLPRWEGNGSVFLSEHAGLLADGLHSLFPEDTVGVAHWCDSSEARIDLEPGHDIPAALQTLDRVLEPDLRPLRPETRKGEIALLSLLRSISEHPARPAPARLPVLVFLHEDETGAPKPEVDDLAKALMAHSAMGFVVNDGRANVQFSSDYLVGNVGFVLRTLAEGTGGAAIVVPPLSSRPEALSDALTSILERLHARYQLSFVPARKDGKVHTLTVKSAKKGSHKHPGTELRARTSYLAPGGILSKPSMPR